jgi:hypothetical protein
VVDEFEGVKTTKDEVDTSSTSAVLEEKAILVGGSLFGNSFFASLVGFLWMYQNTC